MKPFLLSCIFATTVIRFFPTGQTIPQPSPATDRVSVLQSISTEEMLSIAVDCMAEEGYDASDMHEALADAMRK